MTEEPHNTTPALERLKQDIKDNCVTRSGAIEERLIRIEDNHLHSIPDITADAKSAKDRSGFAIGLSLLILAAIIAAAIGIIVSD